LRGNKQEIKKELVLKKRKIYILKDKELRLEVIWLRYNTLVARHKRRWKTMELVIRNY